MMSATSGEDCRILAIAATPDTDATRGSIGQLPPPIAQRLLLASVRRTLVRGEALFDVGSMPNAMYGVLAGTLTVSVTGTNGAQLQAATLGVGQWFGEVPLLDGQARVYRALADSDCDVAVLSAQAFERIIREHPDVLLAIARLVCARFRHALAWIEDASLRPLPARLAARLLALDTQRSTTTRYSQDMLAAQLGVSRQSVNRQMKQWQQLGWVRLYYGGCEVLDRQALQDITSV